MNHTATSICNLALDEIKATNIASLNENSVAAAVCRRQYPQALAEVLEAHDWGFARKRVALAGVTNEREGLWGYAYALPGDMALPIRVDLDYNGITAAPVYAGPLHWRFDLLGIEPVPFDYAGSVLFTGVEGAILEYVGSAPETGSFPALFVRALKTTLGANLAASVKGDHQLKQLLLSEAQTYYERAVANNDARKPQRYGDDYIPETVRGRWL